MSKSHTDLTSLPEPKHNILSLGAGVQSTTLLLMSCEGEIPRLDAAIFVDAGWEYRSTLRQVEWLTREAEEHRIPTLTIKVANIHKDALKSTVRGKLDQNTRWASMPFHTLNPDGTHGILRRQCTKEYKLEPIRREIRRALGYEPRQHIPPNEVHQWIGISIDEHRRAHFSETAWCVNRYPLIEMFMSRLNCVSWLQRHEYPVPNRSSCIGCPYHSNKEWRWMKKHEPASWQEAVDFDEAIRDRGGVRGQLFLHQTCVPLADVDLRTDREKGQLTLFEELDYVG